MRKFFITLLAFGYLFVNAQETSVTKELVNKNGYKLLPKKGDYGFGIAANPFLQYFGTFFNKDNHAPSFYSYTGNAVNLKYFYDDKIAFVGSLGINQDINNNSEMVHDINDYTKYVENKFKQTYSYYTFALGIEKWRGENRLQGVYGASLFINLHSHKSDYTYGNPISSSNSYSRSLKSESKPSFGFGANAFVGVEYFFAPKISLGGRIGWEILTRFNNGNLFTTERWDFNKNNRIEEKNESKSTTDFKCGTFNSTINLMFYF